MKNLVYFLVSLSTVIFVSPNNISAQCFAPLSNTNSNITISGQKTLGQTFVSDCGSSISSITVRSNSSLTTIPDVTLRIWSYSINSSWTEIYTQSSITLNGLNTNTIITITGDAEFDLGNTYSFTLEHASINLELRGESVGGFATGRSVKTNMISTNFTSTNDLYFEIEATSLLPVEYVDFDNVVKDNQVYLHWSTKSEENNLGFEIQKSEDGEDWRSLAFISSFGNSTSLQTYDFVDRIPVPGKNYYRLKQIDIDGAFEYSPISVADLAYIEEAKIYPNPATNHLSIYIPELYQRRSIRIFDIHGKQVLETKKIEQFNLELDISNLSDGIYTIKSDKIPLGRFIKKRQ